MPLPIPAPRTSGVTNTTPVPLYWVRYGEPGRPLVILLHGGPGADHRYLLPQCLHLAERYELLLYDQRGGGQSRAENNAPVTWNDHVDDLAAICREHEIEHPALVGYSWGGLLSLLYATHALDTPAGTKAGTEPSHPFPRLLTLMSPAPITRAYRQRFDEALRRRGTTPELVAERERLAASGLRERDPEAYRQRLFELGVSGYFHDVTLAHDLTPFRVVGRVQDSTWASLGDYDLRPALARLHQAHPTVPVRIVHGGDDPIPVASSEEIGRALGSDVTLIEHCGHVPYVERPTELWGAIDPFLEAHA